MKKIYKIFAIALLSFLIVHYILNIDNCSAQWVQMSSGMGIDKPVLSLAVIGNNIIAGLDNSTGGMYLSTNYGVSWTQNGITTDDVACLMVLGSNIYAGTDNHGVYVSTNNGVSWSQTSLNTQKVNSLAAFGTNIFAGILNNGGVYVSTNSGNTWSQTSLNNQNVHPVLTIGTNVFAGTGTGVYISTNTGTNWTQTALNNKAILSFTAIGSNIFAGTYQNGVYFSTDNGLSWTQTTLTNKSIYSFTVSGTNIFAGTDSNGVYLSTNNGVNWIQKNQGFGFFPTVCALLITNNYIFAGTWGTTTGQSVWRRTYSEIIGINNISAEIPANYSLSQNFPNPFNPSTNIRYELPKNGIVKLDVYDALGREVETLVNEKQTAGTYEVTFNATQYPSGVFFYRLNTESFSETKKMILTK